MWGKEATCQYLTYLFWRNITEHPFVCLGLNLVFSGKPIISGKDIHTSSSHKCRGLSCDSQFHSFAFNGVSRLQEEWDAAQ